MREGDEGRVEGEKDRCMGGAERGAEEKFLDQINAFRGAGDRDHALSSSLPTAFRRLFEPHRRRRKEERAEHASSLLAARAPDPEA